LNCLRPDLAKNETNSPGTKERGSTSGDTKTTTGAGKKRRQCRARTTKKKRRERPVNTKRWKTTRDEKEKIIGPRFRGKGTFRREQWPRDTREEDSSKSQTKVTSSPSPANKQGTSKRNSDEKSLTTRMKQKEEFLAGIGEANVRCQGNLWERKML